MSALWTDLVRWWSAGEMLMPVMLAVALGLYALLAERTCALFGPAARQAARADDLTRLLADQRGGRGWQAWVGRYVAAAEELELTRGFALARALTAALPLLGLLGTVTGMVATFGDLGQGGAAAQQASRGIALALATTQYGMCLAIPAVLWEWVLRRRVDVLVHQRESLASAPGGLA